MDRRVFEATDELPFTIVLWPEDYQIGFRCYERVSVSGEPLQYHVYGWTDGLEWTPDLDRAQPFLSGTIKWDGCSNLTFDDQALGALHFCGREHAAQVGALIARLYDLAAELISNWDAKREA